MVLSLGDHRLGALQTVQEMKPSLPNLHQGETYTEWAKRHYDDATKPFEYVINSLIGYIIDLELEMQQRSADRALHKLFKK
jgi:hypothetical protein